MKIEVLATNEPPIGEDEDGHPVHDEAAWTSLGVFEIEDGKVTPLPENVPSRYWRINYV